MMNNKYVVSTGVPTILRVYTGVYSSLHSRREDRGLSAILIVTHQHGANITLLSLPLPAILICHMSLVTKTTHSN